LGNRGKAGRGKMGRGCRRKKNACEKNTVKKRPKDREGNTAKRNIERGKGTRWEVDNKWFLR